MNDTLSNSLTLDNRKNLRISGVKKIIYLNPADFQLETILGNLNVKGSNLEMQMFDIDKGNIYITGNIDSLAYSNKSQIKKEKGFIQKLFK